MLRYSVVLGLLEGLLVATAPAVSAPGPASADRPACAETAPDELMAVRLAASCGQPVEVLQARTPWETLVARPSGDLTWTSSATAVRTDVNGLWQPVDTALVTGPDGLRPVAPVLPMSFSPGGDGPLARLEHQGRRLEMHWLGTLPAPRVSGSTATYASVLPGVDLVLSVDADGTGWSEVLVVHTPEAAGHPALNELRFPLTASEVLRVVTTPEGLAAVDERGDEVFASPAPLMWDSSGTTEVVGPGRASEGDGPDGPASDRRTRPIRGDRVAAMPVRYADGAVTVVPDAEMLADPAISWPVYIDPTWDAGEGVTVNDYAMIQSGFGGDDPNFENWSDEGVGICKVSVESACVQDNVKRLIWEFNIPSGIRGSVVSSAEFSAYKTHAYYCDQPGYIRLYRVNSISSSTTWDNHHAHWDDDGTAPILDSKPGNGNCTGWEYWNATGGAKSAANNSWSTLTLGLRAKSETNMRDYWRRFRKDARLSITFNRYPNTPGTPVLDPSVTTGTGPSGYLVRDTTPTISATVSDPDGGTVSGIFEIYTGGSTLVWQGRSALVASGSTATSPATTTLAEGVLYTVRVWAEDSGGLKSKSWSAYIQFTVDVTAPAQALVVPQEVSTGIQAKYPEDDWAGGPGLTGKFLFKSNGSTDVARYRYSFNSTTYTSEVTATSSGDSSSLISFTPAKPGGNTLRVWSVDKAGWVGTVKVYDFWVNVAPKAAWWWLDGNGTDSVTGAANPLTFTGTTAWVDGPLLSPDYPADKALHLDGATTGAYTAGPLVHSIGSYTVTALVNSTGTDGVDVAVSQDGVNASAFKLGIMANSSCAAELGTRCWGFWTAANDDAANAGWKFVAPRVVADDPQHFAIRPNTWTALAGVYDAAAHELRLYVNGELAGTAPFAADWDAVGRFRVGYSMHTGTAQYFWAGDLDDVRVYRAALDESTIRRIAAGSRDTADIPQ